MKFDILNRDTGKVQFTADIDCGAGCLRSIKIGLSVKWAIKNEADLREADLRGASLRGADLREADLRGASLRGADLREADLRGASLRGADLREADLRGADLIILINVGSEGGTLIATRNKEKGINISRGCFSGTLQEFIKAVDKKHSDTKFHKEYSIIIELIKLKLGD